MNIEDAKIFGIIGGFAVSSIALFLNLFSTLRNLRAQKISNYQEIIKSHRDIWKLSLQTPKTYARLFELEVDLIKNSITHEERLFSRLIFLHMTAAYTYLKYNHMQPIERLEFDFYEVLLAPIPRLVWAENSKYYNSDFKHFVETANKPKGIRRMINKMVSGKEPDYTKPWNVLILTAFPEDLSYPIKQLGDKVICLSDVDEEITRRFIRKNEIDYVVCFGYGRILKKEVFSCITCINIHGGFLPYNRGPNPNLWAWIYNTKKGVSIHYINEGIDTGDLIAQREVEYTPPLSLQTAFDQTIAAGIQLFIDTWPKIRSGSADRFAQCGPGSSHTMKSQKALKDFFDEDSLNLPIEQFCERARDLLKKESEYNDHSIQLKNVLSP